MLFGLVYFSILSKIFIFRGLQYPPLSWMVPIFIIVLIPFIYSIFFIKKSVKGLIGIAFLFVLISSVISLLMMALLNGIAINSENASSAKLPLFVGGIFSANPVTSIDSTICTPYLVEGIKGAGTESCPLHSKVGPFLEIIILSLISFIIMSLSMILGNVFSKKYNPTV